MKQPDGVKESNATPAQMSFFIHTPRLNRR